jgi:S1-C subfamily serine protease
VLVHLHDGRVFDGRVVALDRPSDLAVVAIEAPQPLPYCRLGNSNRWAGTGLPAADNSRFDMQTSKGG